MRAVITEWGAKPSRTSLSTDGIQGAIDACANFGGGTVVVPAGHTFVSGSLVLKAGVELHLEEGSVLLASGDYADYAPHHDISVLTDTVVSETVLPRRAFIAGYRAHGCSITGPGEINGHADAFIARRGETIHTMRAPAGGRSQYLERPFTIFLIDSEKVSLRDFRLVEPAFWAIRLTGCDHSLIEKISIHTDLKVPNADGIDLDRCEDVDIRECELITADDCISLKSCAGTAMFGDVADIRISDCLMETRSGAITLGTESVGAIRDVVVEDCVIRNSHRGLAVRAREGGLISDIVFRGCRVETRAFAPDWWGHGEALHVTAFRWNEPEHVGDGNPERTFFGSVRNIVFENCEVLSEAGTLVWGQKLGLISGVTFRRISLTMNESGGWRPRIDLRPNDIVPILDRPHHPFEIVNAEGVTLESIDIISGSDHRAILPEVIFQDNATVSVSDVRVIGRNKKTPPPATSEERQEEGNGGDEGN